MKLLIAPKNYSSWSVRPWVLMRHFDIPFEEVIAPLFAEDNAKATIENWSAAGKVPVLKDGDVTIWDSLSIMEYVAERFPEKMLWPVESAARAVARSVAAEMHSSFMALRNEMPMNARGHVPGFRYSSDCAADIARVFEIWRDCVDGSGGPFLFGEFCIADAMYVPVISRLKTYGVSFGQTASAYADAVWSLPAIQHWLADAAAEPWTVEKYELG
ncbi:MAG: glutathione S-transferase N-terminal domain-containing protein [Alphaproteobacteria bacterium]